MALNNMFGAIALDATVGDAVTALQIMDDWDESNRAAVNTIAGAVGVQGGSGAVTANTQRVTLATDVALPTGANTLGKVKITDGTDDATVRDVTGAKAIDVAINDASGNQITSFGGGTQYTEGDVDASITGTAAMMEGAGNTLVPIQGTAADGQLVNLGTNNDVTVTSGTVTANAGTNLNTSLLALESGGNLSTIAGAISANIAQTNIAQIAGIAPVMMVDNAGGVSGSGTANKLGVVSRGTVWANAGATWERMRQIENGFNSSGTGTMSAGVVGQFDDTTPTTITENSFGALRISANRNLYGTIRDAAGNERGANVTASNELLVKANAGTDLNTSLLALESGGNLAAIAASASVLDDWDESDRAKTNPIVGQAGVQGGAGASTANTQRVAIATDANAVTVTGVATAANQSSLLVELQILNGAYAMRTDDTTGTVYQGWAVPGTLTSAASWRVKKIVESGTPSDFVITWADGNNSFDNIWDNRASLTYS